MEDFLDLAIRFITNDIFIGFGLFSIIYVVTNFFKRDIKFLEAWDSKGVRFILFTGLIYFALVVIGSIYSFSSSNGLMHRQYWWAPWIQPVIWIMITQLFWIRKVRSIKLLRILVAVLLIISFERYVIIVTSFHRDYLPGTWAIFGVLTPAEIILGLTTKVIFFVLLSIVYSFLIHKLKLIFSDTITNSLRSK